MENHSQNESQDKNSLRGGSTRESPEDLVPYGDNNTPEIDYNRSRTQATNVIPDEVPRRDGPGGA